MQVPRFSKARRRRERSGRSLWRRFWTSLGRVFFEDPRDLTGVHGASDPKRADSENDNRSLLGDVQGPGYDSTEPISMDKRRAYAVLAALSLSPWLIMALSASIND